MASPFIRPGCSVACGIQIEDHEALGIIAEVTMKSLSNSELSSIAKSIRAEVMKRNGFKVEKVSLVAPGMVTSVISNFKEAF